MKKLTLLLLVIAMMTFTAGTAFAEGKGIGIKGGWSMVLDDYDKAKYDDTWNAGGFFDMGKFLFDSLKFRPGLDYVKMKNKDNPNAEFKVWGIHLDWYWFFLSSGKIRPFLGFGPALNYYKFHDRQTNDNDSDAGIEGFGGVEFDLTGSLALMLEARYLWHDIADRDKALMKYNLGFIFKF